ncbi:hypothetical protein [Mucilaginibacter gossypii]|uniref:Uncharacterized protein n=1 Tax=Mucilaginibacter gossypii TaxID=551996 RepID=A0A1G7RNN0_9SPHI|nr:hypothetical protein [Mucilaginibacter gossypii]SDG12214.1 hypothetical protein SAMN05192573_102299 [Mucilaginibacter gossypii]
MKSKALLLLFIFLLNTVTGFACALRMSTHEHDEATEHHHDGNGGKEQHHDETTEHHHEHGGREIQAAVTDQLLLYNQTSIAQNDPCCQNAVNSFNTLAKVTPQSAQIILLPLFSYLSTYYQFFFKPVTLTQTVPLVLVDGRRRPPPYSIRVALQSFQI